jgi:hypothetical protein
MKTASVLGHKDPGNGHNHYKALVVKATALKFGESQPDETGSETTAIGPETTTG